jgi:hypothetical protein
LEGSAGPAQLLSSHDVGQQVAEAKFDVRLGEKNVRQPVQARSLVEVNGAYISNVAASRRLSPTRDTATADIGCIRATLASE